MIIFLRQLAFSLYYLLFWLVLAFIAIWIMYRTNLRIPVWYAGGFIAVSAIGYSLATVKKEQRIECFNTILLIIIIVAVLGLGCYAVGRGVEMLIGTQAKFVEMTCLYGFAVFIVFSSAILLLWTNISGLISEDIAVPCNSSTKWSVQMLLAWFISLAFCATIARFVIPQITSSL